MSPQKVSQHTHLYANERQIPLARERGASDHKIIFQQSELLDGSHLGVRRVNDFSLPEVFQEEDVVKVTTKF
jgi:hypothetical protein